MATSSDRQKNIFVIGYDESHGEDVKRIPDVDRFCFYPLLYSDEVVYQKSYDVEKKLEDARKVLNDFDGPVDGIICHWDFPATSLYAMLCEEFELPGPSLEAILKCAHKYWSRLAQREVVPENTPAFCAINPFAEDPMADLTVDFPFWIKPITGYGSALGFRINNEKEFRHALEIVRQKIHRIGDPFNDILHKVKLPEELKAVGGNYVIAEEFMSGREIAPEGAVHNGVCHVHGVIDMVRAKNHKSFLRYEYPSQVAPKAVQEKAGEVAEKVLNHIGFDHGCFNMEFFWDEDCDKLCIIEINPRISQSHSYQFEMVDGMSNHEVAIHVALGDKPQFEHGAGPYGHAAKFLLRHYSQEDAIAKRVPTQKDIERLKSKQPDTDVSVQVKRGQRLSTLLDQDAYSYLLAEVMVAANTQHEMLEKYREAVDMLPFELEPLAEETEA